MTTHICAWCGRKCNNGWYRDSFIAYLPIIDDFSKAFCSRRCRSAFRNQKQRDNSQKDRITQPKQPHTRAKERTNYVEPILSGEELKPRTREDIDLEFYEKQKELEFNQQKQVLTQQQVDYKTQQRQLKILKSSLFPNNNLQERVENMMPMYALWGKDFIKMIYDHSKGMNQEFGVILE